MTVFARALDERLAAQHASGDVRRALWDQSEKLAAAQPPMTLGASAKNVQRAIDEAFLRAFRVNMLAAAAPAIASAAGAMMIRRSNGTTT